MEMFETMPSIAQLDYWNGRFSFFSSVYWPTETGNGLCPPFWLFERI